MLDQSSLISIPEEQSYGPVGENYSKQFGESFSQQFGGQFGDQFGGQFVGETLMEPLRQLTQAYEDFLKDEVAQAEVLNELNNFVGRPTALTYARRLSQHLGGAKIYLKREDLNHTGAHKINNCLSQMLLAKKMGKKQIIAETGAGQHGVATATMASRLGLPCRIYMGQKDAERQKLNVFRMKVLGAKVVEVEKGSRTLKDAINEALRDWVANPQDSYYLIGSALGPYPYPQMVREFQSVIGLETKRQILQSEGKLPDTVLACVGGGSNAIGMFSAFIDDIDVQLIGVEAGGKGLDSGQHAARMTHGKVGFFQGTKSLLLQDEDGQVQETYSISAGLDYSCVGPEHAHLFTCGRVHYTSATDEEVLSAFSLLSKLEGILPALESSHAVAEAIKLAPKMKRDEVMIVNVSGRGDKDLPQLFERIEND